MSYICHLRAYFVESNSGAMSEICLVSDVAGMTKGLISPKISSPIPYITTLGKHWYGLSLCKMGAKRICTYYPYSMFFNDYILEFIGKKGWKTEPIVYHLNSCKYTCTLLDILTTISRLYGIYKLGKV